ncbi:unnamed protein product, partial [Musa textilis]
WLTTSFVTLSFPSPPPLPPSRSLWWRRTYSTAWWRKTTICLVWMSDSPSAHQLQWKRSAQLAERRRLHCGEMAPIAPR